MNQLLHPNDHWAMQAATDLGRQCVTGGGWCIPWAEGFDISEEPEDGCLDAPDYIPAGYCYSSECPWAYLEHVTGAGVVSREYLTSAP